jgi:hypothetical protein
MVIDEAMSSAGAFDSDHKIRATRNVRRAYRQKYGFSIYLLLLSTIISMVWQWWLNRRK